MKGLGNQRPLWAPDQSIARSLLNSGVSHTGPLPPDGRPLIDQLHEATFSEPVGLQWIKDKYALRMLLRKAHCFALDKVASALVADFSVAIAKDLESARQLAIPPFPVTWIDIDNRERLKRIQELGVSLSPIAKGATEAGPPVERVGWLIHPSTDLGGLCAHYVAALEDGVTVAPLVYWWHVASELRPQSDSSEGRNDTLLWLTFGVDCDIKSTGVYPCVTPMHIRTDENYEALLSSFRQLPWQVQVFAQEIAGELRHIWGFLIALGAGQLGVESTATPQPKHHDIRTMPNGKPLLPLEHKLLHLHLAKRTTPEKVVARAITHHKLREHEVRAHWRTLKNTDGTVRKRVQVRDHKRGDARLGRIEKTYIVER
jgi:hypothetical protein